MSAIFALPTYTNPSQAGRGRRRALFTEGNQNGSWGERGVLRPPEKTTHPKGVPLASIHSFDQCHTYRPQPDSLAPHRDDSNILGLYDRNLRIRFRLLISH